MPSWVRGVCAAARGCRSLSLATGVGRQLSPAVLSLVNKHNLDPSLIPPTGPKGHILKGDILSFLESGQSQKPVSNDNELTNAAPTHTQSVSPRNATPKYEDLATSNMRRVISTRLTESKTTIPHAYATVAIDMTKVTKMRKDIIAKTELKFSLNDLIIKTAAIALRMAPFANAIVNKEGDVVRMTTVDVSVAVATESGLITPIVPEADGKSVFDISATVKDLAGRAREGKILPHEYQGGSFTISNLGMFGIREFSGVINPPQVAILAVGGTIPTVSPEKKVVPMCTFTLSTDARACNEQEAGQLLITMKKILENPDFLF
eukprot:m.337776 g.337776  ORF g.337776 m.337776 type:complete len:320 (+) comp18229_c0_seq1:73-1032(+)